MTAIPAPVPAPLGLRVLFVDDDAKLLSGLARICYSINPDIDVFTANGAQEGLALLASQTVDAVVSDLHMPGMNGAEFLAEVRNRHPLTLRFVLSGEAKPEVFLKASMNAMRCFSKPCEISLILETIQSAIHTLSSIQDKSVALLVSNLGGMPSCNSTLSTIHQLINDPSSNVSDIVEGIRKSPGIVARILKIANSPFFGRSGSIGTLDDAIALLGMDSAASMITTQKLFESIVPARESNLKVDELWSHCSSTSSLVRILGPRLKIPTRTCRDAMTAALLHDIGKLVLAFANPTGYAAASVRAHSDKMPHWQAEIPIFQNTHAEIGAKLLRLWSLPDEICRAVNHHHTPHREHNPSPTPAALVHAADCLSHHLSNDHANPLFDGAYLGSIGLPDTLEKWVRVMP